MYKNFNSHAHVERDVRSWTIMQSSAISTHTLTWSVTAYGFGSLTLDLHISTHTLTWSVTLLDNMVYYNHRHFNSHAHVERDGTGGGYHGQAWNFNSHAHVERDRSRGKIMVKSVRFQLTRSRGA